MGQSEGRISGESRFFDAKKGGSAMCDHENLKAVGHKLFCIDCGIELPLEFLVNGRKQGKEQPEEKKTDKPTTRKRTPKTAK